MAYTINLTDGDIFAVIPDGTINDASSMTLVGKNYAGYGLFLNENFIHLLENGANTTAPSAPLTGQLWWDKTNNVMKVWNGTTFKTISAATASSESHSSTTAATAWAAEAELLPPSLLRAAASRWPGRSPAAAAASLGGRPRSWR